MHICVCMYINLCTGVCMFLYIKILLMFRFNSVVHHNLTTTTILTLVSTEGFNTVNRILRKNIVGYKTLWHTHTKYKHYMYT